MRSLLPVLSFAGVVLVAGLVVCGLGWVPAALLVEALIHVGLFVLLCGTVTLPWNLYFEARALLEDHAESERRGIETSLDETSLAEVRSLVRRLMLGCLALHLGFAIVVALVGGSIGDDRIARIWALIFALSVTLRPLWSFYRAQRERLARWRHEVRFPRDDVLTLQDSVTQLEHQVLSLESESRSLRQRLDEQERELAEGLARLDGRLTTLDRSQRERTEQVCREFTRSIEALTEDRELLRGIRAFVKMVKET